jgi:predicted transcriptional regulator
MTTAKTWRAPDDLHERLRETAFRTRIPANRIITEAVREWLDRNNKEDTR